MKGATDFQSRADPRRVTSPSVRVGIRCDQSEGGLRINLRRIWRQEIELTRRSKRKATVSQYGGVLKLVSHSMRQHNQTKSRNKSARSKGDKAVEKENERKSNEYK